MARGGNPNQICVSHLCSTYHPVILSVFSDTDICANVNPQLVRISLSWMPFIVVVGLNNDNRSVFIPAQIINFGLVPPHLRFVFIGVVSLFWSKSLFVHCLIVFIPK